MILEYMAPGARRHTRTAGTTEAGLLGLLDVGNHEIRVQKDGSKVNATFAAGINLGSHRNRSVSQLSLRDLLQQDTLVAANLEARGGIEPPIKVLQTFALPLGDRASESNVFYHLSLLFRRSDL